MIKENKFKMSDGSSVKQFISDGACVPTNPPSMAVSIKAGQYKRFGKEITIANDTEIKIDASSRLKIAKEEQIISDEKTGEWQKGTVLKKTVSPVDTFCRMPKAIVPESVKVYSEDGATVYSEEKDYFLDHFWGGMCRIASGSIKPEQKILVDYEIYQQRVDLIQVSQDGTVSVKKGKASSIYPQIPEADKNMTPLASIYVPFRTTEIVDHNICPYPQEDITWREFINVNGRDYLQKTIGKLKNGESVKVVCWGDSITEGFSTSSPEKRYPRLIDSYLKDAYPSAQIEVINAGIGGTGTEDRRDGFQKEVLDFNPDLITVEFVNDVHMPAEKMKANWHEFVDRARAYNPEIEFILITPSYMMHEWMGNFEGAMDVIREIAGECKVALADTAKIWANLQGIGIPYESMLANVINHPNDTGHEYFAATIMALLGPAK